MIICFVIGPKIITWLKSKQADGQPIRVDGPETHYKKRGTPTMGGVMILISVMLSTLLLSDLGNNYVWIVLFVTITFGSIGFYDDYLKLTKKNTKGLSGKKKLLLQFIVSLLAAYLIQNTAGEKGTYLSFPIFKDLSLIHI